MGWIFTLLRPFLTPILGVVAVLCLALSVSQCTRAVKAEHRAGRAEKLAVAVQADLSTCRTNTSALKAAVDRQNDALDGLKAEADAKVAQSRKAVSAARSVAESARQEARRILAVKPGSADRCEAASMLIGSVE